MPWSEHEIRLFGHRGASAHLPENTIESFRKALEDGATALELDVHLSADGRVMVAHDPDGKRMADQGRLIRDCTSEDLIRWNMAATFGDGGLPPMTMPTLDEVLSEFPDTPISVDMKPQDDRIAVAVFETVRELAAEPRVTVGSFTGSNIRRLRHLGYRGPTALTRSEVALLRLLPGWISGAWIRGQAAMIPRHHGKIRLDRPGFIARCRAVGLRVDYWVVNDPDEARELISSGATGLVSDDPGALVHVVATEE
jgi:glycerophosphoryl diester phosphodiesterase